MKPSHRNRAENGLYWVHHQHMFARHTGTVRTILFILMSGRAAFVKNGNQKYQSEWIKSHMKRKQTNSQSSKAFMNNSNQYHHQRIFRNRVHLLSLRSNICYNNLENSFWTKATRLFCFPSIIFGIVHWTLTSWWSLVARDDKKKLQLLTWRYGIRGKGMPSIQRW